MLRRGPVLDSVIQFVDWICRCAGVRYWIRWTNCCAVSLSWFVVVFVVVVAGTVGTGYSKVRLLAAATAGRRYVDRCCSCC